MFERRPSDSRIDLSGLRIRSGFSAGAVITPTYAEVLRDTYLASEVWPLVNISAGTTISAFINSNRNGTLSGWALQNAAGPVTGTLAPSSDGVNDFGNIYTTSGVVGLQEIFNSSKGSMVIALQVSSAAIWTDGVIRKAIRISAAGTANQIMIERIATNNRLRATYRAGSVTKSVDITGLSTTGWLLVGCSWDTVADEFKVYSGGSQFGATQTSLGVWSTPTLTSTGCVIGSNTTSGDQSWSGWLGYAFVKFGSVWTAAEFTGINAALATAGPDL